MYVNGCAIFLMVFLNMLILNCFLKSSFPGVQIVGALMRNSSALILWLLGPITGCVVIISPKVRGYTLLLQMSYLNVLCSFAFLIVIVYHGYSATIDVYTLSMFDHSKHLLEEQLVRIPLICKIVDTSEVDGLLIKLSNVTFWTTINVSTHIRML